MNRYILLSLGILSYLIFVGIPAIISFNCAYNTFEYDYIKQNCSIVSQTINITNKFNTYNYLQCVVDNTIKTCDNIYNSIKLLNVSSTGLCNNQYICEVENNIFNFSYYVASYTYIITYIIQQSLETQYKNETYYYNLTYYTTNVTEYNTYVNNKILGLKGELYLYNNTLNYYSPNTTHRQFNFTSNNSACSYTTGIFTYIIVINCVYMSFLLAGCFTFNKKNIGCSRVCHFNIAYFTYGYCNAQSS